MGVAGWACVFHIFWLANSNEPLISHLLAQAGLNTAQHLACDCSLTLSLHEILPPKKPLNDGSAANTSKQWFSMDFRWCEMVFATISIFTLHLPGTAFLLFSYFAWSRPKRPTSGPSGFATRDPFAGCDEVSAQTLSQTFRVRGLRAARVF